MANINGEWPRDHRAVIGTTTVGASAAVKTGMTLRELRDLIYVAEQMAIDPETVVKVRVGWSGQILRATVGDRS